MQSCHAAARIFFSLPIDAPETISFRLRLDYPGVIVGASTICRYLKQGRLKGFGRKEHLRRRGKRKVNGKANCNTIRPERTIPEWPEEIKLRLETGHYEGDTVQGKTGTGGILTFADRKNRYLFAARIESKSSEETRKAIVRMLRGVDVKSISPDNGCEFAQFRELEKELKAPVYFAEPHKPRQRGTNENTNGLLRFYFPKGFDFRTLTDEHLQKVVDELNNRPRKRLGPEISF